MYDAYIHLLCGPLLLLIAFIFGLYPPKKINGIYGYRTKRSMSHPDLWTEGNRYSQRYLVLGSMGLCVFQLLAYFLLPGETGYLASVFVMILMLIGLLIMTERHLKQVEKRAK